MDDGESNEANSPIKTQNLSENKDQDHSNKDAALGHVGSHALVANDADAVSGRETRHANRNTAREVHEAAEQAVV